MTPQGCPDLQAAGVTDVNVLILEKLLAGLVKEQSKFAETCDK